jgi:hypothetical protein
MEKDAAYAKRMEVSASWIEVAAEAEDRSLTKRFLFLGPVAVPVSKQPGSRSLAAHDLDPFPGDVMEVWKKGGKYKSAVSFREGTTPLAIRIPNSGRVVST